ncbi:MAG: arginine decarboxylase, pyruvoyl-dependent [Armatimonadetes bacterium]|nr:arginine decarboxylase, pyruvoyl-dependent [Armatimonadota bacterium]MDW8154862.1 arginine decarboxylase, pyruvoyl-dependent [Armatimonadota bacterium]
MWMVPKAITLTAGSGEGSTEINAFDRALLNAGIANLNFLRVTSILPAGCRVVPMRRIPAGTLMPAVYARISSHVPGERIAAAIGVGFSEDSYGVIMEYSHRGTAENAEQIVRRMVREAFESRDLRLREVVVESTEHVVERIGCSVAAVLFWPD